MCRPRAASGGGGEGEFPVDTIAAVSGNDRKIWDEQNMEVLNVFRLTGFIGFSGFGLISFMSRVKDRRTEF